MDGHGDGARELQRCLRGASLPSLALLTENTSDPSLLTMAVAVGVDGGGARDGTGLWCCFSGERGCGWVAWLDDFGTHDAEHLVVIGRADLAAETELQPYGRPGRREPELLL